MIFNETLKLVEEGRKTQTRRKIDRKPPEPGKNMAVQPDRGVTHVCRVKVIDVRRERLGDLSLKDARAEGFQNRREFIEFWKQMHGAYEPDEEVRVIEFLPPIPWPDWKRGKGTYALLLYSDVHKRITIGKLGKLHIVPGWYVYIGSAMGPGGLSARINYHLGRPRMNGSLTWHVRYLRRFLPITEIWYTHDHIHREHDWTQTLAEMTGAKIPLPGFGSSDCTAGCEAHLIWFPTKPSLPLLRKMLAERGALAAEICVDTEADALSHMNDLEINEGAIAQKYNGGRLYLEDRRKLAIQLREDISVLVASRRLHRIMGDGEASQLVDRAAEALGVSRKQLLGDAKLAEAIETLIANGGQLALDVLFDQERHQSEKAILALSNTADTRQRYCIERVADGSRRSIMPTGDDPVYDTVDFAEVPSRLRRAAGQLESWRRKHRSVGKSEVADVRALLTLCHGAAKKLGTLIRNGSRASATVPKNLSREAVDAKLDKIAARGQTVGDLKCALKLTAKNVWDFQEMRRRRIEATAEQRAESLELIESILEATAKLKNRSA